MSYNKHGLRIAVFNQKREKVMGKPRTAVLLAVVICFMFVGSTQAQQKGNSRVIYEENTSFKDAKLRARVLSGIAVQNSQKEDESEQKQSVTNAWMEKMLPFFEKFFGRDIVDLFEEYKNGSSNEQQSVLDGQAGKGKFREFSDKHRWKGLRSTQTAAGDVD